MCSDYKLVLFTLSKSEYKTIEIMVLETALYVHTDIMLTVQVLILIRVF